MSDFEDISALRKSEMWQPRRAQIRYLHQKSLLIFKQYVFLCQSQVKTMLQSKDLKCAQVKNYLCYLCITLNFIFLLKYLGDYNNIL